MSDASCAVSQIEARNIANGKLPVNLSSCLGGIGDAEVIGLPKVAD